MQHNSHETKEQECLEQLLLFMDIVFLECHHLKNEKKTITAYSLAKLQFHLCL